MSEITFWGGLSATGLLIGFLSGLFGVGGGFLLTPLLMTIFGVPEKVAVATGSCQMIGTAMAAQLRYARLGQTNTRLGWVMVGGALIGADAGTRLLAYLAEQGSMALNGHSVPIVRVVLTALFVMILVGMALFLLRPKPVVNRAPLARLSPALSGFFGFAMGLLSGLLGIGGGVVLVPLLVFGYGLSMGAAAASATVVLLAASAMSTFKQALSGNVNLPYAMTLLVGSTIGAQWGALRANKMSGQRLQQYFAYLVLATALYLVVDFVRRVL
jgi:hypothetical protein